MGVQGFGYAYDSFGLPGEAEGEEMSTRERRNRKDRKAKEPGKDGLTRVRGELDSFTHAVTYEKINGELVPVIDMTIRPPEVEGK